MTTPFGHFDPAGLHVLHVLLEERHVTRAARRLGISQSSMSHRLARLRTELADPLLVNVKGQLVPTPRALAMQQPLTDALASLQKVVAFTQPFDPPSSHRVFTIGMPDLLAPLVPTVLSALTKSAPNVDVRIVNPPLSFESSLAAGEPELLFTPLRTVPTSLKSRQLGDVRFGVAMRRGHPLLRGTLTVERWLSVGHVVVRSGNQSVNLVSETLERHGLVRRVGVEVPTFLAGLVVVAGSELVMNAPLAMVDALASSLGLVVRDAPVPLPKFPAALVWHERFQQDPSHRWAREQLFEVAKRALQS